MRMVFADTFKVTATSSSYVGKTISITSSGNNTVTLTSSNPSLLKLKVSKEKNVTATALKAGSAKITAKFGKSTKTVTVTVSNCTMSVTTKNMKVGETASLTLKNAASATWSSTNAAIVSVTRNLKTLLDIDKIVSKADRKLINHFKKNNFKVYSLSGVNYGDLIGVNTKETILNKEQMAIMPEVIYFELCYMELWASTDKVKTVLFKELLTVYKAEKDIATGLNKAKDTMNSTNYFSAAVRDYTMNPTLLKKQSPLIYAMVVKAINDV